MSPMLSPRPRRFAPAVATFAILSSLAGCQPTPATTATENVSASPPPATPASRQAGQIAHVCPMHPHIRQHGPGQCPICGMTLVPEATGAEPTPPASTTPGTGIPAPAADDDRRVLYYYDPMRPDVHFDRPGKSPFMDMDLVPKYSAPEAPGGVRIDPALVQNLGIRTARPSRQTVRPTLRVPAKVVADARGQVRLQARVSGWIEDLRVRAVGEPVTAGSVIASLYSPELVQAQEEMLLGGDTATGAAERLRRLGIADADIRAVRRAGKASRRLPLRAPASGVITDVGVREGSSVVPDTVIADIAARDAVWVEAQVFPAQRLQLGDEIEAVFSLPGSPGRQWRAQGGRVLPVVDPVTQTVAIRFALANRDELPLGSVLDGELAGTPRADVLLIPASAVIRKADGAWVLVEHDGPRFLPTRIAIGPRYGEAIEVRGGLAASARIVTSGQFLLDAEADLQAGLASLGPAAADAP